MARVHWFTSVAAVTGAAAFLAFGASAAPLTDPNPAVQARLDAAAAVAGEDLDYLYQFRCRAPRARGAAAAPQADEDAPRPALAASPTAPPAMKVMDNLYFVGGPNVMGWAVKTTAGIIILDALNNPDEIKTQMAPGLISLGLDPKDIKFVVVMHGHGDHFGGAQYIRDTYGAEIVMSNADWQLAKAGVNPRWAPLVPREIRPVGDGEVLALGETQIKFYITPGHTPGTLSAIFSMTDKGRPHTIGFWGGTGFPNTNALLDQYLSSMQRFRGLAKAARVDTLIANHLHTDNSGEHMEAMRANPDGPNPFVVGERNADRFFTVLDECAQAQRIRRATLR